MAHVFISYVRENREQVDRLYETLRAVGVNVWLDRRQILPGTRWQGAIREAIRGGAFFIACFSREYRKREYSYMNEELMLAIKELRKRRPDRAWFIPVLLSNCDIPELDIGAGETLRDLQWINLEEDWNDGLRRLLNAIHSSPREDGGDSAKTPTASMEFPPQHDSANGIVSSAPAQPSVGTKDKGVLSRPFITLWRSTVLVALAIAVVSLYYTYPYMNRHALTCTAMNGSVVEVPEKGLYRNGERVILSANPDPHYVFTGWSGDATGSDNPLTLFMDADKRVTAKFEKVRYTLNVPDPNVAGLVIRSPDRDSYARGDTVTLQAVPDPGYRFAEWSGDLLGNHNPIEVLMDGDKSVTARFTEEAPGNKAPEIYAVTPKSGATHVPVNSLVTLRVSDDKDGIDAASVVIALNSRTIYSGDATIYPSEDGVCRRIGTPTSYTYAYQAYSDFGFAEVIALTVSAKDLAGNTVKESSYSFCTETRAFGGNRIASGGLNAVDNGGAATAVDSSGNIWTVWHAGTPGERDIYANCLINTATSFGRPTQVTTDGADQINSDVAIGKDDRLYVVWQDNRRENWDIYMRTSSDGVSWSPERLITESKDNQTCPAIVVDAQTPSRLYVAWQDDGAGHQDICIASSIDGFATKTIHHVTSDPADQFDPDVAVDSSNVVYLTWTDNRSGSDDIYGASSDIVLWTNVPIVTGPGNQNSAAIASEATGSVLHLVWVDDTSGNRDVCYASSSGLPTIPLSGTSIVDDVVNAHQDGPAIAVRGATASGLRVFSCWQDERNVTDNTGNIQVYFVEIGASVKTNIHVNDDSSSAQSEPAIGVLGAGHPYIVWAGARDGSTDIYWAASTFMERDALVSQLISAPKGGTVGVVPPSKADDVSVEVPANACPHDVTITVRRIQNPLSTASPAIGVYDFGPSGLQFHTPVTITIPYVGGGHGSQAARPYWHDSQANRLKATDIADVENRVISPTLRVLRFKVTHFTPYFLLPAATCVGDNGASFLPPICDDPNPVSQCGGNEGQYRR